MMRVIFIWTLVLGVLNSGVCQVKIESIKIYAVDFSASRSINITKEDLRKDQYLKANMEVIEPLLYDHLSAYLSFRNCSISNDSKPFSEDLRLLCVVKLEDQSDEVILGFSYMDYMTFNHRKLEPRNDQLLLALCQFINDKVIQKSIKSDVKLNQKRR